MTNVLLLVVLPCTVTGCAAATAVLAVGANAALAVTDRAVDAVEVDIAPPLLLLRVAVVVVAVAKPLVFTGNALFSAVDGRGFTRSTPPPVALFDLPRL
jgi:hypothetical protein